jgi:hypothetical protein
MTAMTILHASVAILRRGGFGGQAGMPERVNPRQTVGEVHPIMRHLWPAARDPTRPRVIWLPSRVPAPAETIKFLLEKGPR